MHQRQEALRSLDEASGLDFKVDYDESKFRAAFSRWDREGNGYISASDVGAVLKEITGKEPSETEITYTLRSMDLDEDGKVTYDDFFKSCVNKFSRAHDLVPRASGHVTLSEALRTKKSH